MELQRSLDRLEGTFAAAMGFYGWAAAGLEPSQFFSIIHTVRALVQRLALRLAVMDKSK